MVVLEECHLVEEHMNRDLNRPSETSKVHSKWLHLTSFFIIVAASVLLAGCSGAAVGGANVVPSVTSEAANRGSSAQPGNPNSPAGEEPPAGSSPAAAPNGGTRPASLTAKDQGQGGITIKATWVVPGSPEAASVKLDRELGFAVAMDTHSGDLGQYDLAKISILRDDKGQVLKPLAWESTSEGSHHRAGILTFAKGTEQGSKYLELVISNVGGARERVLRWGLP